MYQCVPLIFTNRESDLAIARDFIKNPPSHYSYYRSVQYLICNGLNKADNEAVMDTTLIDITGMPSNITFFWCSIHGFTSHYIILKS